LKLLRRLRLRPLPCIQKMCQKKKKTMRCTHIRGVQKDTSVCCGQGVKRGLFAVKSCQKEGRSKHKGSLAGCSPALRKGILLVPTHNQHMGRRLEAALAYTRPTISPPTRRRTCHYAFLPPQDRLSWSHSVVRNGCHPPLTQRACSRCWMVSCRVAPTGGAIKVAESK
jgi:hypothetical protein